MAKTTTKSKAQTKTTKKTAAKATSPAAVKTTKPTKKTAAVKADAKVKVADTEVTQTTAKVPKVKRVREVTAGTVRRWHLFAALVSAVLAVLTAVFMQSASRELTIGHLTSNELASKSNTVFAPATHVLYDLDLRWTVVVILVLSAVLSLLRATRLFSREVKGLQVRVMYWRWIQGGLISALITEVVALLVGVQDLAFLKVLGISVLLSAVFGWISERENALATRPTYVSFVGGVVSGTLPWLVVAWYLLATAVYSTVRLPWYVYAVAAGVFATFVLWGLNELLALRRYKRWAVYPAVERNFTVILVLVQVIFAVVLIVGLHR